MDGGAAVYAYDGEGRRMKKTVGSETTYYFYGVTGLLCEFTTTNTGATQAASTDLATYRTSDKLGSAVLILNASGTVIENNRTLPYGEGWLLDVASSNDKKFTTYERDGESGLDYALNRYYMPVNARFVSVDPFQTEDGPASPQILNRYVYTLNDPINNLDPDGRECISDYDPNTMKLVLHCHDTYTPPPPPEGWRRQPYWGTGSERHPLVKEADPVGFRNCVKGKQQDFENTVNTAQLLADFQITAESLAAIYAVGTAGMAVATAEIAAKDGYVKFGEWVTAYVTERFLDQKLRGLASRGVAGSDARATAALQAATLAQGLMNTIAGSRFANDVHDCLTEFGSYQVLVGGG